MSQRRRKPSPAYIADILDKAAERGLTASGITTYSDGSVRVHFGGEVHPPQETQDTWADAF